jgi:hypothetical protein
MKFDVHDGCGLSVLCNAGHLPLASCWLPWLTQSWAGVAPLYQPKVSMRQGVYVACVPAQLAQHSGHHVQC